MLGKSLIQAAAVKASAAGGLGIEELFQAWLYTGNGSTQTITNGIDLAGEGGLVWMKSRSQMYAHYLQDTNRGTTKILTSNSTASEQTSSTYLDAFNSDGFRLSTNAGVNQTSTTYASWTFRKAPGFFDVVTFTAGSSTNRRVSHSLGSAPGMIIMKRTDGSNNWAVYHRSLGRSSYIFLNLTSGVFTQSNAWGATDPTSTDFGIDETALLTSGGTYVAYLFAHDEQIFGEGGDQSVIKCGGFTGAQGTEVTLGWEPQWILIKWADAVFGWNMYDAMRGMPVSTGGAQLQANTTDAEASGSSVNIELTPTGFKLGSYWGATSHDYIYIAIRRGPMKTPTSGTEVFNTLAFTGSTGTSRTVGFPIDLNLQKARTQTYNSFGVSDRLRGLKESSGTGTPHLYTASTAAETTANSASVYEAWNTNRKDGAYNSAVANIEYNFRRAPGFFDVVAYTGTGVARTVAHNLGVAPELIITKARTIARGWVADYVPGNLEGFLDTNSSFYSGIIWNNGVTATGISTTYASDFINGSGSTYIAYLFATLPGISKVFSFTGNGTSQTIDCGFAAGARFVLLKRTDSAGSWLVADTARGIVSGNDPLLYLNSTAAEITTLDWIDPHSSGFIVNQEATANANVGGATYIGLAIA